jgi:general stress protein 26
MAQLSPEATSSELKRDVLAILDENRVMTVATARPDGWPQATMVGFIHDALTLYFAVAQDSQKLANIKRDPRVSIALGRESPDRIRGLSMAATAREVEDLGEVARLNELIIERYPGEVVFAPRRHAIAVICARPQIISFVDQGKGPGAPLLLRVDEDTLQPLPGA